MTTLVDQIITELATEWNANLISDGEGGFKTPPTFYNSKSESRRHNGPEAIGIRTEDSIEDIAVLSHASFIIDTPFRVTIDSDLEADRDSFIGEVKRIIRAKSISGGWWEIGTKFNDDKKRGNASGFLRGKEERFE